MAQQGWVYLDDVGGQHRVGLYHGDRSKHLVIYCDMKVVQVDFNVKDSCTYSFFIEEELCEVILTKAHGVFNYSFQVNKDIDTPKNRLRKLENKRNLWKTLLFYSSSILVILALFFGMRAWQEKIKEQRAQAHGIHSRYDKDTEKRLQREGKTAKSKLYIIREAMQNKAFYTFRTDDNEQISGKLTLPDSGLILPSGFPLADKDEFNVTYLPSDPKIHHLRYDQPTQEQITVYFEMAVAAEIAANPSKSANHARCAAHTAYQLRGWNALAHFIYQQKNSSQNPDFNQDSYLRLTRDVELSGKIKERCWAE